MKVPLTLFAVCFLVLVAACQLAEESTLEQSKATGASQSKYLDESPHPVPSGALKADLKGFQAEIAPILAGACVQCHGPDKPRAGFRVDTLDPDLVHGGDADWWLEVVGVLTNGEMPPPDSDVELSGEDRGKVIDWLSMQALVASRVKRSESEHSSFRRMTRYEFSYALQDLLDLSQDFAIDLPPETISEDGFHNSSEMLQMTSMQFSTYQSLARQALKAATFRGPRPEPMYFAITMDKAETSFYLNWARRHHARLRLAEEERPMFSDAVGRFEKAVNEAKESRLSERDAYFMNLETGKGWNRRIPYGFSLWKPTDQKPVDPEVQPYVLAIPHGESQDFDLGDYLPERGLMKVRFRASRASDQGESYPSLRLLFGFKGNNNSTIDFVVSEKDLAITASPDKPAFYEFYISLDAIRRNPYRGTAEIGKRPNPSERITFVNVHQGSENKEHAAVHIDYIEITAPVLRQWPPASHRRVFPELVESGDELKDARTVLEHFMPKAWRRPVTERELDRKLALFKRFRPITGDYQDAMVEVLATVLASPNFLYLTQSDNAITDAELASRLSFFLWSSQPDKELLELVFSGRVNEPGVLAGQARRMLDDPRAERLSQHFTHQWLGMESLDFLDVNRDVFPSFSSDLKQAMQREPIEFFRHVLDENRSVIDFLHADYAMLNQRLARHYAIDEGVYGNHFRKVDLGLDSIRGGLLTQAGLLAMNSDGNDSNPLKRGVWLLESILRDPPPPPPPAVPQIDLADPEIMKMTLKERMEDHRSDPACYTCHAKIDPWGIALEQFDAIGAWRDEINGQPVDARSELLNKSELDGIDGLKRYLLETRQDQFVRAIVHKMASYALGRPLSIADYAEIERISAELRQGGDGLKTLVLLLVESDLFQKR